MKSFIAQATGSGFEGGVGEEHPSGAARRRRGLLAVRAADPGIEWREGPRCRVDRGRPQRLARPAEGVDAPRATRAHHDSATTRTPCSSRWRTPMSSTSFAPFEQHSAGTDAMVADIKAFKPDAKPSTTMAAGYFSADFFIKAIKKAGLKNLTRESVQKAAAHMTYRHSGHDRSDAVPEERSRRSTPTARRWSRTTMAPRGRSPCRTRCTNHFNKVKGDKSEVG